MLVGLFFLNTLPILCFVFFGVRLILEMYWRTFAVQNTVTEPEPRGLVAMAGRVTICVLAISAVLIFCLAADSLVGAQVAIAVLGYVFVLGYTLSRNPSTDAVVLGVMGPVQAVAMLWASDLITMFFVLEFTNALILYSMLFSATYLGLSGKGYAARVSMAFVYQFVINFFSSVILYVSITRFIAVTGSADLTNLPVWANSPEVSGPLSAFILAFLIKFGTGP